MKTLQIDDMPDSLLALYDCGFCLDPDGDDYRQIGYLQAVGQMKQEEHVVDIYQVFHEDEGVGVAVEVEAGKVIFMTMIDQDGDPLDYDRE